MHKYICSMIFMRQLITEFQKISTPLKPSQTSNEPLLQI